MVCSSFGVAVMIQHFLQGSQSLLIRELVIGIGRHTAKIKMEFGATYCIMGVLMLE